MSKIQTKLSIFQTTVKNLDISKQDYFGVSKIRKRLVPTPKVKYFDILTSMWKQTNKIRPQPLKLSQVWKILFYEQVEA